MIREIKFRAWDEPSKSMVEDAEIKKARHFNQPLMQFTGLKDEKGKEIFEGDIVKSGDWIGEIKWCRAGYDGVLGFFPMIGEATFNQYYGSWEGCSFEVIGNIYENPELLNG